MEAIWNFLLLLSRGSKKGVELVGGGKFKSEAKL